MIIDEKRMQPPPPPPYLSPQSLAPPPFPAHLRTPPTLPLLPAHILLQIVYMTFPQTPGIDEGRVERQRKTLYWFATSLRLVNRALYIACMHVLRSTYLPSYDSLIRPPYTSDPFPLLSPSSPSPPSSSSFPHPPSPMSPLQIIQRETSALDHFIALKVREDVWTDDSELHLEREESFKDLFDHTQPKARSEDLVRIYGVREGIITIAPPAPARGASTRSAAAALPIPFGLLSVSFSPRKLGLVLSLGAGRKRTIVEVPRTREEKLEVAAKRIVRELRGWRGDV